MKFFKDLKIRHKLTILMTATSMLALMLVGGLFILWGYVSARQGIIHLLSTQAAITADNCQAAIAFDDAQDAESVLYALRLEPSIMCAGVYTKDGTSLAHYKRNNEKHDHQNTIPPNTKPSGFAFENGVLMVFKNITLNEERVGYVILRSDLKPLRARVKSDIALVASILCCAALIAYLISKRLQKVISGPILNLANTARQISQNTEFSVRASKHSEDETGVLIDAFNEMLHQIQQRDRRMIEVNQNLEATVQERTKELTLEIAERKQTAETLEQERNFTTSIIETAQAIILILDTEAKIVSFNPYMEEKSGYRLDEVKGLDWFETFIPSSEHSAIHEIFKMALLGKHAHGTTNVITTKDNRKIDVEWYNKTLKDEHGNVTGVLSIGHDVTERKIYEDNLKQAKQQADAANEAKSNFLANMSHEIRTPMNAIIGFSDLLAEEPLNEDQLDSIDMIRGAGKNLLSIINDILDFSKIEANKLNVECVEFSLEKMLHEFDSIMRPAATKKDIQYEVVQCGSLPKIMKSDPLRLRQCLTNLINNAIKFTEKGHVFCNVSIGERNGQECVIFDVEDTGIGISRDKLESIFEEFNQADNTTTRKYGGTGLGLAITGRLAELMGGSLNVASELGKGSTFTLTIPAGIEIKSVIQTNKYNFVDSLNESKETSRDDSLSGKILAAEDNRSNQVLLEMLIEKLGLEITTVNNGQEAVDTVKQGSFDLVFMDMQMPVMNGFDATKTIRQENSDIPIIALTASAMKGDDYKCIEAGCNAYLSKPIDRAQLVEILRTYLPSKTSTSTEDH